MNIKFSDKGRLLELDCVRNLATIFILSYHFVFESNAAGYISFSPFALQTFSILGSIGVNLFFLLSGASLTYRWRTAWNPKEYAKGRILSIYPDFWVAFFSLFFYYDILHGINASVPKWKIVFSVLGIDGYMQQFTPTFYKIGEWFLGCLLILYLLFPIFRHFVSPNRKTFILGSILLLIWLIWPSLCLPYDGNHTVLGQVFVFWIGMMMSHLIGRKSSCKSLVFCGAMCGILALFRAPAKYTALFFSVFIILLVFSSAEHLRELPRTIRTLIYLFSKQSYRVFLVHHLLLVIIVLPNAIQYSIHPFFTVILYSVSCILLSIALGFVSKPLSMLLKKILNH